MARLLFLDDELHRHKAFEQAARGRGHTVVHVSDPTQAIRMMERAGQTFDAVFLDRDLSNVLTGEHVAQAMTKLPRERRPKKVVVHSHNDYGGDAMVRMLRQAGYHVVREKFAL